MARRAITYSRIRGAGGVQSMLKRRTMCPFTWLPRPRTNRPPDCACRSQAMYAMSMGLRAKARAMEVRRSMREVCSAANTRGKKGLWSVSLDVT